MKRTALIVGMLVVLLLGVHHSTIACSDVAPKWEVDTFTSWLITSDGGSESFENYVLVYGDCESWKALSEWMEFFHRAAPAIFICHGRILEMEDGKPTSQVDEWEILIGQDTCGDYAEQVSKFASGIDVSLFPYRFAVLVYYPWIDMYRLYVWGYEERDGATLEKWQEYADALNASSL